MTNHNIFPQEKTDPSIDIMILLEQTEIESDLILLDPGVKTESDFNYGPLKMPVPDPIFLDPGPTKLPGSKSTTLVLSTYQRW